MTIIYHNNDSRICRQTFAVWQQRQGGGLAVVTWEDNLTEEVAIVGEVYNNQAAAKVLGGAVDAFIDFATKKLREELYQPISVPPEVFEAWSGNLMNSISMNQPVIQRIAEPPTYHRSPNIIVPPGLRQD